MMPPTAHAYCGDLAAWPRKARADAACRRLGATRSCTAFRGTIAHYLLEFDGAAGLESRIPIHQETPCMALSSWHRSLRLGR